LKRAAAALVVAWSAVAAADDGGRTFLHKLAGEVRGRLDVALKAHAAKPAPPHPVEVHWKPTRIGSIELGAPLAALVAADLHGDRKAELYAVTANEVVAIAVEPRVRELGRVAFAGDPAVPRPRDVVGAAFVDRDAIVASASGWAHELRVTWQGKVLRGDPGDSGFELCAGEHAALTPGRNYFGDGAAAYFAVRCADVVEATGTVVHVRAQLAATGKLDVTAGAARHELSAVGVMFEIADLDRDGTAELIYASAEAPGDPDVVKVVELGGDERKPKWKKKFAAGGVAGLAVGDFDGDGAPEVIAAVRLVGATRVDLWRLN
jgi:hypothetical protein